MYEDPSCYSKLSEDYKKETRWVLGRLWDRLDWGPGEVVLDVGCGSGDTLYHVILPELPADFKRMIGVDMSPLMIEFAYSKWKDPRLSFQVMDISTKKDIFSFFDKDIQEGGGFHKITSFFCLQWVKNRRQMLSNLYQLLRPGGSALLLLVVRSGVYNVWDKMARSERWKKYLQDIKTPLNEYIYMEDYEKVFCDAAKQVGFSVAESQVLDRRNVFTCSIGSDEEMIWRLRSVDPFLRLLPESLKEEYLKELLEIVKMDVSPKGATDYTGLLVLLKKE